MDGGRDGGGLVAGVAQVGSTAAGAVTEVGARQSRARQRRGQRRRVMWRRGAAAVGRSRVLQHLTFFRKVGACLRAWRSSLRTNGCVCTRASVLDARFAMFRAPRTQQAPAGPWNRANPQEINSRNCRPQEPSAAASICRGHGRCAAAPRGSGSQPSSNRPTSPGDGNRRPCEALRGVAAAASRRANGALSTNRDTLYFLMLSCWLAGTRGRHRRARLSGSAPSAVAHSHTPSLLTVSCGASSC